MKKVLNMIITFLMVVVIGVGSVNAGSCSNASSIKAYSKGKLNYISSGKYFPVKYLKDGTLVYCVNFSKNYPVGTSLSNPKAQDLGVSYIINKGYKGTIDDYSNTTKMKKYYVTQYALYVYLGQESVPSGTGTLQTQIKDLVNEAKAYNKAGKSLTSSMTVSNSSLTEKNGTYQSELITFKSNDTDVSYKLSASGVSGIYFVNSNGTKITTVKSGTKFRVVVPTSSVTIKGISISVSATGSKDFYASYKYTPSDSSYQPLVVGRNCTDTVSNVSKLTFKGNKTSKVTISKVDSKTGSLVAGATLEITDSKGNKVATFTSGATTKIVKGLSAGTYYLQETKAPNGYKLSSEKVKFVISDSSYDVSVKMNNTPYETKVKVSKQDVTTKSEVAGAKLAIKDANGKQVITWTSTTTPKVITGLPAGTYSLVELEAPNGYVLNTTPVKFTVKADGNVVNTVMYNTSITHKVIVNKLNKVDGSKVAGAKLAIKDSKGNVVISWTSSTTGKVISGLPVGSYELVELEAPEGYKLSTESVKFNITNDNVKDGATTINLTIYNEAYKTNVKVAKVDAETNASVKGATMVIKDITGKEMISWETGDSAKIITGLPAGTYYLSEKVAPEGYKLSTEVIEFTVKADGKTVNLTYLNKKETKVQISKQDITNKQELPGATLVIKDSKGNKVNSWVSTNTPKYIEGLEAGDYTLTETIAPEGYELSTETIKFTVKADGSVTKVTMYNTPKKTVTKVQISKQDITNKQELPGATLVIKDSKGNKVTSWVSTNTPKYIEGLEAGDYTLTETIAPEGYELSTETIKFTVKADGSITKVTMYNTPKKVELKSNICIYKKDSKTGALVAGATMVVKDANGKEIEKFTTTNAPHSMKALSAGTYYLSELEAPKGYKLNKETIKFVVKGNEECINVTFYNTKEEEKVVTKVKISKQDITTKAELPGATLVIKDSKGNKVTSWVSTNTPKYIEGLEAGDYTLSETIAPNGYKLSTETVKFTVKADGSTTYAVMYNTPVETKVKVDKLDSVSLCELPGAVLAIKDADGKEIMRWTSTTESKIITGLKAGEYTLVEISAPNGYALNLTGVKFTVKNTSSLTSVVMYNTPYKTKVEIEKLDKETNKQLAGATLVITNSYDKVIKEFTTTDNKFEIEGLSAGTYYLSEKVAPNGYKLSTEKVKFTVKADGSITNVKFYNEKEEVKITKVQISKQDVTNKQELPGATLVIKDSKGNVVDSWVSTNTPKYIEALEAGDYTLIETSAPEGYILSTETIKFTVKADGSITKVTMYNTPKKEEVKEVKVSINKLDSDTKKFVTGATLVVKDANGKVIKEFTTDGKAYTITGLEKGEYTVTETKAPNGYVLDTTPVKFTVAESDINVNVYNKKEVLKSKVCIYKKDSETGSLVAGATMVVKDANGKVIDTFTSTNAPHAINDLTAGTYYLTETSAPEGYKLSTESVKFIVNGENECVNVTFYNSKEEEKVVTKVQISKQDITNGKEVPGATLVIKNSNGEIVKTIISGNKPTYIEALPAGDYTLTETMAPEGYELSNETVKFTVKADGSLTTAIMYNTPIKEIAPKSYKVKFMKLDSETKAYVAGATLVVRDSEGKEVLRFVSTNEPYYVDTLEAGDYTLEEAIAPNGYALNTEKVSFKVTEDSTEEVSVTFYNNKLIEMPITSSNASIIMTLVGLLGTVFGITKIYKNAKQN